MNGYPRRYIVLDTETKSESVSGKLPTQRLTFRLAVTLTVDPVTFGDDEPHYFETTVRDDLKYLLVGPKLSDDPIYIFAHNMGFDSRIAGIWNLVADGTLSLLPPSDTPKAGRYKEPLFVAEDYVFIVRLFRKDGQRFILLDTVQWLKKSLAKVGDEIRVPKLMQPDADAHDDVWMRYCRGDVDTLHSALLRLWGMLQRHGIEDWDYTPASLSRRFYRMRFERKRIRKPDDVQVLGLDRLGYYGGLLECFRVGPVDGPIYQVDVNSLYPHVMSQNPFPCEVLDYGDATKEDSPPDGFRPEDSTAEVWLSTDDHPYPVRGSDQTYYVSGSVRTVLCGPELSAAWRRGHVCRVGRWVRYRTEDLFSSWATYWRRSREHAQQRGDRFTDGILKNLMNSLHGKFGQQLGAWQWIGKLSPQGSYSSGRTYNRAFRRWMDTRCINGEHWERGESGEDPDSFVPVAAWTASYGREYMRWMIETAGPDNVLYIATDSLLTNSAGYHALNRCGMLDSREMGKFKTEGMHDRVAIWNVNQLDLGTSKRRSGVKLGSQEIEPGIWSVESWETCAAGVTSTGQDSVSITTMLLRPSLSYSRRMVLPSGWTEPWSIDCWSESPEAIASAPLYHRLKGREK